MKVTSIVAETDLVRKSARSKSKEEEEDFLKGRQKPQGNFLLGGYDKANKIDREFRAEINKGLDIGDLRPFDDH